MPLLLTDDSQEQTRRVYASLADLEYAASEVDFEPWHALQAWLAAQGETRVAVPFVRALADAMPVGATRLRRDFATLLSLVRAHATLYRAQRESDDRGRLVATIKGDYAPVRDLVSSVIAEAVDATVSEATRETVDAVREIIKDGAEYATPSSVALRLRIGRSASYDRIKRALASGHLTNLAGRNERTIKLGLGEALPGDAGFLPTAETVVRAMSGGNHGHRFRVTVPDGGSESECPGHPEDPTIVRVSRSAETVDESGAQCRRHGNPVRSWLGRDGLRRCFACDPPIFQGEIVAEGAAR